MYNNFEIMDERERQPERNRSVADVAVTKVLLSGSPQDRQGSTFALA